VQQSSRDDGLTMLTT